MSTKWHAIILAWIISFWAGFLYAEERPEFNQQLPMMCGNGQNIIDGLNKRYDEEIVFLTTGVNNIGDELFHSLWTNQSTGTWTFLVLNKNKNVVCIIASGDNFKFMTPDGI